MEFYNRGSELEALTNAWDSPRAQLVLLYGRRRIGKTYLLQHFLADSKPHCYFLAAQTSTVENMTQLAQAVLGDLPESGLTPTDLPTFRSILHLVGQVAGERRFALVLDEFQYLVQQDPSIPSQIQVWWDAAGLRSNVFLVLCGSHIGTMERLGGSQAPLFGRLTFRYQLPPMNYWDTALFYGNSGFSCREKLMAYGMLGGTPRYHALFNPRRSVGWNVCNTILNPIGLLHNEIDFLISSSQVRDPAPYNAVLRAIAEGTTRSNDIAQRVGVTAAQLSFYLRTLMDMGWVSREQPFGETSSKRALYQIADPFIHFCYRFLAGLRSELEFHSVEAIYRSRVEPYLNDYMGWHVFEDVCRQYLRINAPRLLGQAFKRSGRFWSRDGKTEVDLVAEMEDGRYLVGECKWSSSPIGPGVYYGLRAKSAAIPVLGDREDPVFALFSLAGFEKALMVTAKRDKVLLVSGEDLLR